MFLLMIIQLSFVIADHLGYFCQVYYEKASEVQLIVKLFIVKDLKALEEVIYTFCYLKAL